MRADGSIGRAVFNTSILRLPDGTIDGVIGIGQDRERVRSLERQVIQAEKLATLGQLAAGVVHELNNPLTSISVYGEYLLRQLERAGQTGDADKARKIVDGATRIQKLTRDLISYARPSGEYELISLAEVVRQAIVFCEHVLKRAEARLELDLDETLPRVPAIRSQLHQVLINLVTNSCHALPAPDQVVRIETALAPDMRHVRFTVADTGVGIDALDRDHVFEPFFTTKKEGKGTGLGLSIVKNIVERHGGQITFDSRVGMGTAFHVLLPLSSDKESLQ
jgi:signal transduction histidine kinase